MREQTRGFVEGTHELTELTTDCRYAQLASLTALKSRRTSEKVRSKWRKKRMKYKKN